MRRVNNSIIIGLILCISIVSCIKPERDNEYDPNNPCKASVKGAVFGYDGRPIHNANVGLFTDGELKAEIRTDPSGKFMIEEIDPGIYDFEIKASGYMLYADSAESLWAGREMDSAFFYLEELYFDFEEPPAGTIEPYTFDIVLGTWAVVDVPDWDKAYAGFMEISDDEAIVFLEDKDFGNCYVDVKINFLSSSTGNPGAFLLVKFQDPGNFYWIGIGPDYIKMYKREAWNHFMLYEDHSITVHPNQWYELRVEIDGNVYDVELADVATQGLVTEFNISDAGWNSGKFGFYCMNWDGIGFTTDALFDDLYIDTRPQ